MLNIHLHNDNIVLRGSPEDSPGTVVSGTVIYRPSKATKVKQILLKLHGTLSIDNNQDLYGSEKTVIRDKLVLLDSAPHSLHHLGTQEHRYDFNLPLSGDLPESVDLPHGKISYMISAVVIRPFPHTNLKHSQELKLQRVCSYETARLKTSARGTWCRSVHYSVSLAKSVYLPSEQLKMTLDFLAVNDAARAEKVYLSLVETIVYKHPITRLPSVETVKLSHSTRILPTDQVDIATENMCLDIPNHAKLHCQTGFISVTHCVHIKVKFQENHGKRGNIEFELPVIVQSAEQREIANALPSYDDAVAMWCEPPPAYQPRALICH
ncbi:hypothetical protein K493DRAFT_295677 [Basidiobolus meristosporus CBS 931.73]|uniref:Arrestin C-terminal-like domain-containing protein n=1 Tax=Basidiobolus meristosporus CBS 931.73 TaxID=1314790 RepID=A0A1Y1Z9Y2_9FUNG|nr:hypothetical protein K493DRAFT_295677 [Basidiobolus meristosporus CBS 931.73]|eukprot:ORY07103.1 hypothetical protein K493DRAFT_295677 [Basidiobolus meristosporus CBS 931.73]